MKKIQEIIGISIISISDGIEVGKVKSAIINAEKGAIEYIVVDNGIQILSARVIPTDNILGIGEYALTIENDGAINDIGKIPEAIDLLQKNIQVRGTKVLTKKGRLIGEIGDVFFDESNCCKIIGLEYISDITQKKIQIIPRGSVITFGKNLVVVKDDVEDYLVDRPAQLEGQLEGQECSVEIEKKNPLKYEYYEAETNVDETLALSNNTFFSGNRMEGEELLYEADHVPQVNIDVDVDRSHKAIEPDSESASIDKELFLDSVSAEQPVYDSVTPEKSMNAAALFEQKQRKYLNGRRATKTVVDNYGNVIIGEGDIINDVVVDEAKAKGKLIELVMNNKI